MKKMTAIFICLVMLVSFVGCNNAEKKSIEAGKHLTNVLNSQENFNFKSLVFDKVTKENLEKFSFSTVTDALNSFVPWGYTSVDLDSDNIEELIVLEYSLTYFLVLRYNGKEVDGYILKNISLQDIKTDGSFKSFKNEGYTAVSRAEFKGLECNVVNLAYMDDSTGTYEIDQKKADKAQVEKYFDDWSENTTKVEWLGFE